MNRIVGTAVAVLVLVMAMASIGLAADRVGVIDLAVIMDESKAGKQANAALAAFIDERQQAAFQLEEELEQLAASLDEDEGGAAWSGDERATLEAELDAAVERYIAAVNEYEAEIDAALEALRDHILSEIGIVLQMVGDSRGFDIILDSTSSFYYRRVVDLTFEVIREYDVLWEAAQRQASQQ